LAVGIAGHVDRDLVVLMRGGVGWVHLGAAGHSQIDRHVLTPVAPRRIDQDSAGGDENNQDRGHDKSASSAHAISSLLMTRARACAKRSVRAERKEGGPRRLNPVANGSTGATKCIAGGHTRNAGIDGTSAKAAAKHARSSAGAG